MRFSNKKIIWTASIFVCLFLTVVFDVISLGLLGLKSENLLIWKNLSLSFGSLGIILLMRKEKSELFKKPQRIFWFLPALIMAVDNFQWMAFLENKMQLRSTNTGEWIIFCACCFLTGLFEECIFRGVLFPLLADRCEKSKKGLLKTVVLSSLIFGGVHLLNVFSGGAGVLLQAGYCILTGGMFAFVLIKTKNIFLCAFAHGLYNFCGTLFSESGLGTGVVFDLPTALTMFIVSIILVGIVLWGLYKYTEEERVELYARLGFGVKEKE